MIYSLAVNEKYDEYLMPPDSKIMYVFDELCAAIPLIVLYSMYTNDFDSLA